MPKKKKIYMPEDDMDEMEDMMEMQADESSDMGAMHMNHMMPMAKHMLAHAYVPWQQYNKAFTPKEALAKGTLFPELWGVYPIPK